MEIKRELLPETGKAKISFYVIMENWIQGIGVECPANPLGQLR